MASINFYLDKPNSEEPTYIFLRIIFNKKKFKITTGESIQPKYWNFEKQESRKSSPTSFELNHLLNLMKTDVEVWLKELRINQINDPVSYLKNKFTERYKSITYSNDFYNQFDKFIEISKTTKGINILGSYRRFVKFLREFADKTAFKVSFENMNYSFYNSFINYMIVDKKLINNTIGYNIKTLKTFLHYAEKTGIKINSDYKTFKVLREDVELIYLTQEELERIEKLEIKDNLFLDNIRDLFLLQCFTGLRASDLNKLSQEHIAGDFIRLRMVKTKDSLNIPITASIKKILDKYPSFEIFRKYNKEISPKLKEIGERAKILDNTLVVRYRGSERIETILPKYKLIGTHTARRTFVTLSLERGMRPEIVMRITGHKDYSSFKKYIKLTESVTAQEMNRIWS